MSTPIFNKTILFARSIFSFRRICSCLLVLSLIPTQVYAACLGLGIPAPHTTNICETIFERVVVPQTRAFCDIPWYARIGAPHCNIPGACHVDPTCKSFETITEIASLVLNAGDLYCEVREIQPLTLIEKLAKSVYSDIASLTTGGISSTLYQVAGAHIDILECEGQALNGPLKDAVNLLLHKSRLPTDSEFSPIDVDRVRIVSRDTDTAGVYLTEGYAAITLDSVVILRPELFDQLSNWKDMTKLSLGLLVGNEREALLTMVHELVHVRQYRAVGREQFINLYLSEALASGYANISSEEEAKEFEVGVNEELAKFVGAIVPIISGM